MHYSIIPAEIVFDDWDGAELEEYRQISYENRQFIVEPVAENQVKIVQLLSTDPMDFLNPAYSPGSVIEFSAQVMQD